MLEDSLSDKIIIGNDIFLPFITEEQINARIKEIGVEITKDYKEKIPVFIGVLNGACLFHSDLIRNVNLECEVDFFKLSSYGDDKISSGKVRLVKDLGCDVNGRDIIIVEDIVDSGLSIKFIKEMMEKHTPASMKVARVGVRDADQLYAVLFWQCAEKSVHVTVYEAHDGDTHGRRLGLGRLCDGNGYQQSQQNRHLKKGGSSDAE